MTTFLYFRNQYNRLTAVEKLFAVQRLRHWLLDEFKSLKKVDTLNSELLDHLNKGHLSWDEAWWIELREFSKAPLFRYLRQYL